MLLVVIFCTATAGAFAATDQWSQAIFAAVMVLAVLPQIIGAGRARDDG